MKQTSKEKGVFLEILRKNSGIGKSNFITAGEEICYAAWCESCNQKVELVLADKSIFKNNVVKILHVQLLFAGKLLACFNSLNQAASIN